MEQSPSREANRFSASQEINRILRNILERCSLYINLAIDIVFK